MLAIESKKILAMKLDNPQRVTEAIHGAKMLNKDGKNLVFAPHEVEPVMVLNNLGIKAPSPILHYYNWPGRFTPYDHQKRTAAFLTITKRGLVLNEIGTGKTASALWAADYLMTQGLIKKVLIISPLSTLERVWGDAIFESFHNRNFAVLHGTSKKRHKLLKTDCDFYVVNHDGFKVIAEETMDMFDLVIVDEAAVYRNPSSQRYKFFKKWLDKHPSIRLWLMTGTPTPNEPTDAWTLSKLVNNPYAPARFTHFRDMVMVKIKQFVWAPRHSATSTVKAILQPSIRYSRDECFDLPKTVFQTRTVELTTQQKKYYNQMMKHFIVQAEKGELDASQITAVNEAVKLQKLVQISCGVAYDDKGGNIELDCAPRVKVTKEIIEQAGGKVIVFVPLTGTLKMLERELSKHWNVGVVNGAVSATKRNQIFHDFQKTPKLDVLIAHPATMAHGLTLTAASTIVWYGPVTSNEQYVQANGRIERIGKNHSSNVVHIEGTQLEHKMYARLRNKQRMQGLLLDMIEDQKKEK